LKRIFLIGFLASCLFCSCTKEALIPDLEGSLTGYVYTFDEFADRLPDRSGVLVEARGLKGYVTFTDVKGRFEFKNLPAGTYRLKFRKEGFGTLIQEGIKHLGGKPTTLGLSFSSGLNSSAFFIYQIPVTEISDLKVENDSLRAVFRFFAPEPERMNMLLYLSDKQGSPTDRARQTIFVYLRKKSGYYTGSINFSQITFGKGEKIYCRACILNRKTAVTEFGDRIVAAIDSYFDYDTYKTVYPNIGDESEEFTFVNPE
jgi:hypothetical protein